MVLGEPTPGDFALRDFKPIAGDHHLYIASHLVALSNGRVLDGSQGVVPDVEMEDEDVASYVQAVPFRSARKNTRDEDAVSKALQQRVQNDAILQRATDVLLGLKALNLRSLGAKK